MRPWCSLETETDGPGNQRELGKQYLRKHRTVEFSVVSGLCTDVDRSKLIDDMEPEPEFSLAYFYCNYQEVERTDPAAILRSLVKQLCLMSRTGFPVPVLSIYNNRKHDADLTNLLSVEECEQLLMNLSTGFLRTTIVIDALDECDPSTRGHLCDVLQHIVSSSATSPKSNYTPVKIFITSRNEGDLSRRFEGSPNVYIQERDNSADINLYIETEVTACIRRKELLGGVVSGDRERLIIKALKRGARGM